MKISQRTIDGIHVATVAGCLLIIGMTIYNWRASGRIDFGSIGVVVLIFSLVVLQRVARRNTGDRTE